MNTINLLKRVMPTLLLTAVASPAMAGACLTDFDGDDATGFGDLTALLNNWGPCDECPQDIDGDGAVGFSDLTALLNAWGPCPIVDVFDYPVYENQFAVVVGQQYLHADGPVALPQETYDRTDRDMDLIIAERPELTGSDVQHEWRWAPFQVLVGIDMDLPSDAFEATLAYYQGEVVSELLGGSMLILDFPLGANPMAMVPILDAVDSVQWAQQDTFVGTSEFTPRWEPTDIGGGALLWTVAVGWDDGGFCDPDSSPCECFTTYQFVTEANGTLIPLSMESIPSPWNANGTCDGYPPMP